MPHSRCALIGNEPKTAATVVLLRPGTGRSFEVLLTRRPDAMPFLGGKYCFPGGAVQKADTAETLLRRCRGVTPEAARNMIGAHGAPRQALGVWIAAVRELFEEVGVLLAVDERGDPVAQRKLWESQRASAGGAVDFKELLRSHDLYCDLPRLRYFSHWQTPSQNRLRFDTWFFLALLPPEQTALEGSSEVAETVWLTPDEALHQQASGALPMIFPTFASLRTLANFDTIESVIDEFDIGAKS